jgi:hypothetical protein
MFRKPILLAGLLWITALTATGQTIPPETRLKPDRAGPAARKELRPAESLERLAAARAALRAGDLWSVGQLLQGRDFIIDLDSPSASGAHLARALIGFSNGDLTTAHREAVAIKDFAYRGDACVLLSLIYARANVWPLSREMLEAARGWDPLRQYDKSEREILKFLDALLVARNVPTCTDEPLYEPGRYPGFRYRLHRAQGAAAGDLVVTVWRAGTGADFRAAFALDSRPDPGSRTTYSISLYDLEGAPLRVAEGLATRPTDEAFLAFARSFDPAFGKGRFTVLRAELEALSAYQQGLTPLAARWAEYADTRLVRDQVEQPLRQEHAWKWTLRDAREFGPWSPSGFRMLGYVNDEAGAGAELRGPLEHYHFAVFARNPTLYAGSYAVASDEAIPGERLYFLKRIVRGVSQVVATYPALPTFDNALAEVKQYVRAGTPAELPARERLRIEDRLTVSDEDDPALPTGDATDPVRQRRVYHVRLAAGVRCSVTLTSWDFIPALGLADERGEPCSCERDRLPDQRGITYLVQVRFVPPRDGVYRIIVSSGSAAPAGRYALTVQQERQP